jgi:hypothetical protein
MKRTAGFRRGTLSTVNCGYSYTNGFVVLAEHLDMFRLGPIATGGKVKPSDNLSLRKRTLVEYSRDDITLFDGLCGWGGGSIWLTVSMIGEAGRAHFSVIPWHLPCN